MSGDICGHSAQSWTIDENGTVYDLKGHVYHDDCGSALVYDPTTDRWRADSPKERDTSDENADAMVDDREER